MKARSPIDGKWYLFVDKCVSFGSAASCKLFQDFSDCLAHLVQWRVGAQKKVTNYLDDFLFVALLKWLCNLQYETFLKICEEIHFPVSLEKTFWAATQMVFLGFLIDTDRQIVCIPTEKVAKGINMISFVLNRKKITVYQLQQLCGFLNFLCKCIVPGRAFTRRLYVNLSPKLKSHHHISVHKEMQHDLGIWLQFLKSPNVFARPFMDYNIIPAHDLDFYTDASKNPELGFGGYFNEEYFFQQWDKDFIKNQDPSIGYLELYAVSVALLSWMPKLKNRRVTVFVDNKEAKSNLNNMTSKCKNSMLLIRLLVLEQMIHNVRIFAKYVKSEANTGADDLFRLRVGKFLHDMEKKGKSMIRVPLPENMWPMEKIWHH